MGCGRITVMGVSSDFSIDSSSYALLYRSYESYCDLTRQYDPNPVPATLPDGTSVPPWKGESIDKWIKDFGRKDLLDFSAPGLFELFTVY